MFCHIIRATYIATNPFQHDRTKHADIDSHFVRERVATGEIHVLYVLLSDKNLLIFSPRTSRQPTLRNKAPISCTWSLAYFGPPTAFKSYKGLHGRGPNIQYILINFYFLFTQAKSDPLIK